MEVHYQGPGKHGNTYYAKAEAILAALFVCPMDECRRPALLIFGTWEDEGGYRHQLIGSYPRGTAKEMVGIREEVERDRAEAWSCFYGGDVRAAVIMGRAALQRAVRILGADGADLYAEIDDLLAKQVITRDLAKLAHEVRLAGNDAAHPATLGEVDRDAAEESLDFLDDFLRVTLVTPAKVSKRASERGRP